MGTWGYEPWESDEAADWLAATFEKVPIDERLDEALRYSDTYGAMRSAAYVLTMLGRSAHMWPGDPSRRLEHIERALTRLRGAIEPGSDDDIRRVAGEDSPLIAAIEKQILALEAMLDD